MEKEKKKRVRWVDNLGWLRIAAHSLTASTRQFLSAVCTSVCLPSLTFDVAGRSTSAAAPSLRAAAAAFANAVAGPGVEGAR